MILSADFRKKFTVFLFIENNEDGALLRGHLAVSGYEVFLFRDQETLIHRIKESSPHLVVFDLKSLMTDLSEFVESCLKSSPEVAFLPLLELNKCEALEPYREYNFIGILPPGPSLDLRCLWQVDEFCSELFFQYQNEQLLSQQKEKMKTLQSLEAQLQKKENQKRDIGSVETFSLLSEKEIYRSCQNKEDLQEAFLNHIEQKYLRSNLQFQALVLKFLPTVQSFVAVRSVGLDLDKVKGIGARLEKEEAQDLFGFLSSGQCPQQLTHLMQNGLGVKEFVGQALILNDTIEGLFVFWLKQGSLKFSEFANEYFVFQMLYQNMHLLKKLAESDLKDPVTELEGRDYYFKKMNEEIARSRRLQKAVSVLKISIDHFTEIEQSFGVGHRNAVLRSVATLVKRTSRINDFVCRTEDNEISVLLPHCARKGAAIRAERVRRMIENHSFNLSGHRVTVSCGISEYPTLCGSGEELEKTSQQAVQFIQEKGGNKVCLYRAVQDFRPDFDVPPI